MDRQAITDAPACDRRRREKRLKIGIQSHLLTETQRADFGAEILSRLVLEVSRHAVLAWQALLQRVFQRPFGTVRQALSTKITAVGQGRSRLATRTRASL